MKWNHYTTKSVKSNDSFVPFYSTCLKSICSYFKFVFFSLRFSHCLHRLISIIIWSLDLFFENALFPNINKFLRWLFSEFLVISFASVHSEMKNVMIAMVVAVTYRSTVCSIRFLAEMLLDSLLLSRFKAVCYFHFQIYSHGQK